EHQLNELDKQDREVKKPSSKSNSRGSRSHSSPSLDSAGGRFERSNSINTPCYVPGGEVLPILIRNEHSVSPSGNGDAYNTNIYTVDNETVPEMCDSAYSSGNSTPSHSIHNSPPAPFSTFGYKKDTKFKAEAKIEVQPHNQHNHNHKGNKKYDADPRQRPYSVQTTKSAPDVIVTH
ncbi:unnamed protein product, partial [Brassicogethes aeneus]